MNCKRCGLVQSTVLHRMGDPDNDVVACFCLGCALAILHEWDDQQDAPLDIEPVPERMYVPE